MGVQPNIIDFFLSKLEHRRDRVGKRSFVLASIYDIQDEEDKYHHETGIGPFVLNSDDYRSFITPEQKRIDQTKMTPVLVAFNVAENIINNYEEEERIVPRAILNEFDNESTRGIHLALESIQNSYEKKSAKDMLTPIVTATDLICNLIPELAGIKDVGPKIKKIYETEKIYSKYNINREVLWSLNNSRIIRNYDIHKPEKFNHTSLHEAVGYTHLLILLISSLFSSGNLQFGEIK